MKLSTKVMCSMGALTALILILGTFLMLQLQSSTDNASEMAQRFVPMLSENSEVRLGFVRYRLNEALHIFEQDSAAMASFEKIMAETKEQTLEDVGHLRGFIHTEDGRRMCDTFRGLLEKYFAVSKRVVEFSRQNNQPAAYGLLSGEALEIYNEMFKVNEKLRKFVDNGIRERDVNDTHQANQARLLGIVIMCVSLVIAVMLTLLIVRNVKMLLGKDPAELNALARRVVSGDYRIDDGGRKMGVYGALVDMVGSLEKTINKAELESQRAREASDKAEKAMEKAEEASREAEAKTRALMIVAEKLEKVGTVVSTAATELSAQIEQSDKSAGEAAARLSEAATAMNEMNATVQEVARNASSASQASSDTKDKASAGAQVVERSLRRIEAVHQVSLDLKNDMAQLNDHAHSIDQIMSVISDIADQTNLLALNAAIEAARAGEAGRGFAVVADEVRKLAEKTMSSTQDVSNAIKAIQESTAKSSTAVDNAVSKIEEATQFANESGHALEEIVANADSTADQVNAIAAASEEQSAASEEINHSIIECNEMSGQIASAMKEANKAVTDLAREAQELSRLILELKQG